MGDQQTSVRTKQNERARRVGEPKWYIVAASIAALLVLVISGYTTTQVQKSARNELKSLLLDTLNATHARMLEWERLRRRSVEHWALDSEIVGVIGTFIAYGENAPDLLHREASDLLTPALQGWDGQAYSVVSLDGRVLTSSQSREIGTHSPIFTIPGFVTRVLEDKSRISKPMYRSVSDLHEDRPAAFAGREHLAQYVAAPVRADGGNVIAILVFELDPVQDFSNILASGRARSSLETFAIDVDGTLLSESRFNADLVQIGMISESDHSILNLKITDPGQDLRQTNARIAPNHQGGLTLMASGVIQGEGGYNIEGYQSYMGHRVVGAWLWVEEMGLGLATEMLYAEAYATYLAVSWQMMAASILAAVLLVGLAVLFNFGRARLSESARRLQSILDNVMDGIIVINETGVIESYNASAARIFGYDVTEIEGHNISMLMPDPDKGDHDRYLQTYLTQKTRSAVGVSREVTGVRKDGTLFPLDLAVTEMQIRDRKMFLGITRDITDRKQAEEELRRSEEDLKSAQRIAKIGGWSWNLETNDIYWTEELFNILGRSPKSFENNIDAFIKTVHPDDREDVRQTIEVSMATKSSYMLEHRIVLGDGSVRIVMGQGELTYNSEGKAVRLNGIVHDITDRKAAEHLKSEFVSTVSHELRTPLTSIHGSLGLLVSGAVGELSQQCSALLSVALKNSDRLVHLIDDILDVEKLEAGRMVFDMHPHVVDELVLQALEVNKAYADTYDVRLICKGAVPNAFIEVDSVRFAQVMANLISNAVKFSPKGGEVMIKVEEFNNRIRVSVTDNGPGIPTTFQSRIFKHFTQADASDTRQKGGTGLGLSITKAIVEKMQGEIDFLTEDGNGTTFYFDFDRKNLVVS
ncbi:PAS domain S-box protein [Magnetovibrio sp. PR-2]|uniref:PAS domain S-box protein n=1 Tax=Magnetovibrio sp. PR-2 TaxID=3120356 RepID=UPI002FCE4638